MTDTNSFQEERLGLRYWTIIEAICVVVDGSKCPGIPIWEFSKIFGSILHFYLRISRCCAPTILIALHNFAWHSKSDWCFQFLTSILNGLFELLVLRVNEIDPSQFSCVIKMELFMRPLLLLLQLGVLSH